MISSAGGLISLLEEPDQRLQCHGLKELDRVVGSFWFEIADAITTIERFSEDGGFPENKRAALLASKVYFHLGEYEDSLMLALTADELFYQDTYKVYVDTITGKGVDHYTRQRHQMLDENGKGDGVEIDPRLEAMVNRIFERCFALGQYKEAIGIAIETRRTDMVKTTVQKSGSEAGALIGYCETVAMSFLQNRAYRNELLRCLIDLYSALPHPDFVAMCQCLISLEDPDSVADILTRLAKEPERKLVAYQIAFDLVESCTQQFLNQVVKESMPDELRRILSGTETINLHMQFLIKNNKTDMLVLKNIKDAVRNSVGHTGTVIANGFMHCGTTTDDFLRENLEWVSKATNWSKFSAVATLGIVHKGHEADAMKLLEPYLPKDTAGVTSGFMEGGAFYALGLIHANHGNDTAIDFLKNQLDSNHKDVMVHGACLGLGLAAMGTGRQDIYDTLRSQLYQVSRTPPHFPMFQR